LEQGQGIEHLEEEEKKGRGGARRRKRARFAKKVWDLERKLKGRSDAGVRQLWRRRGSGCPREKTFAGEKKRTNVQERGE